MTSNQIIKKIQTKCPKFSAVTLSMVRHSEEYGIIFSPKALSCINLQYTEQSISNITKTCMKSNKTSQENKKKRKTLTKEQNEKLKEKLKQTKQNKQEYILELIKKDLENEEHN